jgi:hypothetical protein
MSISSINTIIFKDSGSIILFIKLSIVSFEENITLPSVSLNV